MSWSPYRDDPPPGALAQPDELPSNAPTGFQAGVVPVGDRWVNHPGHRLTAAKIRNAFANAEGGWPEDQCDIFDDRYEADAHLRDAFQGRNESVARKDWILIPGGDAPADIRAAELLDEALRNVCGLTQTFEHQLSALRYGYAYSEIMWERRDRLAVPVHFENVIPRRFRFADDNDRPLLVTGDDFEGEDLVRGKWWRTELTGRKKAMAGLMRTAVWWSMFKTMAARDWVVFANRYGLPYAWATYDNNLRDEKDKDVLKSMMKSLGTDGWAVFQRGVDVQILEANKTGGAEEVHGALVTLCNQEISKLVTGATLISENSGPGSFAATREHGARGFQRIAGDAKLLSESFEDYVGRPFVEYNGIPARPPKLKIHIVRDSDPLTRVKVLSMVVNELGVDVSKEQVRQEIQLKTPASDDDIAPGKAQPAPSAPGEEDPPGEDPDDTEETR